MEGYEVIGSDDAKVGEIVAVEDGLLIVERGRLRKTRHAVPEVFAHPDDDAQVVRLIISKELVAESPELEDGEIVHRAVARHFGLAEDDEAPDTHGRPIVPPDSHEGP